MASADLSEELECPVCLDIYTDPVTLRCGHNFCRVCIERVLDSQEGSAGYSCPECRKRFKERPGLQTNIALKNIAERSLSTPQDQEASGVHCTYCVDSPVPAVKSCLHCDASMCDKHLRVHSKAPEHVLCAPTASPPEIRKCSVHKKILEYYCINDDTCVCVSCYVIGGHVGHKMVSLDEAFEEKKKKLRNDLQTLMIEEKEAEKRVQNLKARRRTADDETERVTAQFRDLRRRLEELEKRALSDIPRQVQAYDDALKQLEIKKEERSRKMRHIEELCNKTDPLTVLQESDTGDLRDTKDGESDITRRIQVCNDIIRKLEIMKEACNMTGPLTALQESDTSNLCDTKDGESDITRWIQVCNDIIRKLKIMKEEVSRKVHHIEELCDMTDPLTVLQEPNTGDLCDMKYTRDKQLHDGGDLSVAGISHTLHSGLADIMSGVTGGVPVQPADILLDVNTAHLRLHISDDRKTATYSEKQKLPQTPERFKINSQVLSVQSFSSGRHYWEVDVGRSDDWKVGMCYPSIDRKGYGSQIGENSKSWALCRDEDYYSVIHDGDEIHLRDGIPSDRVRIYLDYEAGQISFYALCDPIRLLHTFNTTFVEPLHAVLHVGFVNNRITITGGARGCKRPAQ